MIVALLAAVLLIASSPATAEEITSEACLACHGIEGFTGPSGQSLHLDPEAFNASVHGSLPCTTCHTDIEELPHAENLKPVDTETCGNCHGDVVATYDHSVHGAARAKGVADVPSCMSCHGGPHSLRRHTDPASPVYPLILPRTCGACHGDAALAQRHGIPVADAYQLYMDSIHGRALTRSGLLVAANCSSCHGSHDILPKRDPASKVYKTNIPSTCGACHAGVEDAYFQGVHGRALKAGLAGAPICIDCHTAHQIARVETEPWKLQIVKECGSCHEESLKTYRDTFHGQITNLGFTPVARCSDCHGSHRVLPASDPQSTIAPANLVTTCKKCHPRANANFVRFSPHADPSDKEKNPSLYYTAKMMNLLIVGVFVFFGLHTVLWFGRSLYEQRNGARTGRPSGDDSAQDEE
jgi:nitrate/TMAO reductase-like tetraheme cytochrome c subunit